MGKVPSGLTEVSRLAASKGEKRNSAGLKVTRQLNWNPEHTYTHTKKNTHTLLVSQLVWDDPRRCETQTRVSPAVNYVFGTSLCQKTFGVIVIAHDALASSKNNIQLILSSQLSI